MDDECCIYFSKLWTLEMIFGEDIFFKYFKL